VHLRMPVRMVIQPHVRPVVFLPDAENRCVVDEAPALDLESDNQLGRVSGSSSLNRWRANSGMDGYSSLELGPRRGQRRGP
jgi:hypothetical protein